MSFDGEPLVRSRDDPSPTNAVDFIQESMLIVGITYMLDDSVRVDEVESLISEGQAATIREDEAIPTTRIMVNPSCDRIGDMLSELHFDDVHHGTRPTTHAEQQNRLYIELVHYFERKSRLSVPVPPTEGERSPAQYPHHPTPVSLQQTSFGLNTTATIAPDHPALSAAGSSLGRPKSQVIGFRPLTDLRLVPLALAFGRAASLRGGGIEPGDPGRARPECRCRRGHHCVREHAPL